MFFFHHPRPFSRKEVVVQVASAKAAPAAPIALAPASRSGEDAPRADLQVGVSSAPSSRQNGVGGAVQDDAARAER